MSKRISIRYFEKRGNQKFTMHWRKRDWFIQVTGETLGSIWFSVHLTTLYRYIVRCTSSSKLSMELNYRHSVLLFDLNVSSTTRWRLPHAQCECVCQYVCFITWHGFPVMLTLTENDAGSSKRSSKRMREVRSNNRLTIWETNLSRTSNSRQIESAAGACWLHGQFGHTSKTP